MTITWFITLPQIRPQMMFSAVMSITSSFAVGPVITQLCGYPTTDYAGHTLMTHLTDYGTTRFEMGYACALATVLFIIMVGFNLIVKRFLFKPVKKALEKRDADIGERYSAANEAKRSAEADKAAYRAKMENAQAEADAVLQKAQKTAQLRSDTMLSEAKEKADLMFDKAHAGIEAETRRARQALKQEVADLSLELTEKMLKREVHADDHRELIDSFIDEIGGGDGTDQ